MQDTKTQSNDNINHDFKKQLEEYNPHIFPDSYIEVCSCGSFMVYSSGNDTHPVFINNNLYVARKYVMTNITDRLSKR